MRQTEGLEEGIIDGKADVSDGLVGMWSATDAAVDGQ